MKNLLGSLFILCGISFMGCTGRSDHGTCCHQYVCECTCGCVDNGVCTCKQNGMVCQCKNPCCNCANGGKCICTHK